MTTAINTVTLLEKSAGREQAASRHSVAFGPNFRIPLSKITRREAEDFNAIVLDRLAVLVPAREKLADQLHAQLADEFERDFQTLTKNFDRLDLWSDLAKDALDTYQAVRRRDRDDKTTKAEVRAYLRENEKGVNARIDRIVRRANERGMFDGSREAILLYMVLIAESGSKFIVRSLRGELDSITKEILFGYQKAASPADKFLLYFTLGEGDSPPLPASAQMGELLDSIQKRTNEITLGGFNDKMFETVRSTIKENLYEAVDGGKGAAEIARQLGKELRAQFKNLPKEANNRLMLWARTEGCVVQNDALMARGKDVGMDGKVWQTVGDSRVRDAHLRNEAAGVIPIADTFPDGSTDGGGGSVSPFNCRCAVGPALLEKRGRPSSTSDASSSRGRKKPKKDAVPRAPLPKKKPKTSIASKEEGLFKKTSGREIEDEFNTIFENCDFAALVDDIDPDAANNIGKALYDLCAKFDIDPKRVSIYADDLMTPGYMKNVGSSYANAQFLNGRGTITFDFGTLTGGKAKEEFLAKRLRDTQTGWAPAVKNLDPHEKVAVHEFGHILHAFAMENGWADAAVKSFADESYKLVPSDPILGKVSRYAKTNQTESIAESFATIIDGSAPIEVINRFSELFPGVRIPDEFLP